jgi:predicted homoserine dehydrogenase-like protein
VLSAALRGEPTGQPREFRGDVVAVAKRDLKVGEMLDGEGGYTVWGRAMPAQTSLALGALPIGLAHRLPLTRNVPHGEVVRWSDVDVSRAEVLTGDAIKVRRVMEAEYVTDAAPSTGKGKRVLVSQSL